MDLLRTLSGRYVRVLIPLVALTALLCLPAACTKHQRPWESYPVDIRHVSTPATSAMLDVAKNSTYEVPLFVYVLADTGSMKPSLQGGDYVVSARVPFEQLKLGDIVNYRPVWNSRRLTIHRIVAQSREGWILAGDNNDRSETWEPLTPDKFDSLALRFYRRSDAGK